MVYCLRLSRGRRKRAWLAACGSLFGMLYLARYAMICHARILLLGCVLFYACVFFAAPGAFCTQGDVLSYDVGFACMKIRRVRRVELLELLDRRLAADNSPLDNNGIRINSPPPPPDRCCCTHAVAMAGLPRIPINNSATTIVGLVTANP